jgi:hypothetical protein
MSLTYVANLPIPLMVPSVQNSIGFAAITLEASLRGSLALNASFTLTPPTVAIYLAALAELQAQIAAGISLGVPSVSFTLTATLVAQIQLAFDLLVALEAILAAQIGMYAYTFDGIANGMGAALTTELAAHWPDGAPSSAPCNAFVFGAVSPIAQTQIQGFLNGLSVGSGLVYTARMSTMAQLTLVTSAATTQGYAALQAQLQAALALKAQIAPPTLAITAAALAKFAAFLAASVSVPSLASLLKATASLSASISAQFGLLVQLGLTLNRYDAALFCYTYSGTGAAFGAAVTAGLGTYWGDGTTPTSSQCVAVILAATDSVTYSVMTAMFGGL